MVSQHLNFPLFFSIVVTFCRWTVLGYLSNLYTAIYSRIPDGRRTVVYSSSFLLNFAQLRFTLCKIYSITVGPVKLYIGNDIIQYAHLYIWQFLCKMLKLILCPSCERASLIKHMFKITPLYVMTPLSW